MNIVNIHEAKTTFSRLIDRAHGGEEIVVAKAGTPWARIVPLAEPPERQPGRYSDNIPDSFYEPLPPQEIDAWAR